MTHTDVWVHDYTTSTGVQVVGHWRRRRGPEPGSDGHPDPAALEAAARGPAAAAPAKISPAVPGPPCDPGSAGARVAAAEARYRAALVSAGQSALRHRAGTTTDLPAALQERDQARAALDAARAALPTGTPAEKPARNGQEQCPDCGQFRGDEHRCPVPDGLPAGAYAGMAGDARVKAMVADLETSVQAIVDSGQLQRWLDAMASNGLARWSANNRLLAAVQLLQRGESLENMHLMGFRQWEKFNRRVSKGARAVWILAPITRKVVDVDDDGTSREGHRVVGFKGVPVFNISDTHGDPLPSSGVRPPEGAATPGTLAGLRDRVAAAGYTYEEAEIPGCRPDTGEGTQGFTDPAGRRIVIDSRLSDAHKATTLAHELGHVHCGHVQDVGEYQQHRGRMETEAEMTAYLVSRSRGMTRAQVDSFSAGYIATWSKGDSTMVHAALDKATRAYNTIIDGTWPTT